MKDSIKALRELEKRLYAYQYAMAVADYDSETVAPPESSAGRAEAMEVLSRAYFDQMVSADTAANKDRKGIGDKKLTTDALVLVIGELLLIQRQQVGSEILK